MDFNSLVTEEECALLLRAVHSRNVTSIVQSILSVELVALHIKSALLAEQRIIGSAASLYHQPFLSASKQHIPLRRHSDDTKLINNVRFSPIYGLYSCFVLIPQKACYSYRKYPTTTMHYSGIHLHTQSLIAYIYTKRIIHIWFDRKLNWLYD